VGMEPVSYEVGLGWVGCQGGAASFRGVSAI